MKIIRIEMSNNRKIKALDLQLDGKSFCAAGQTGAGKTTIISSLWDVITPIADSLSHGAKKGSIRITLGDSEHDKKIFLERNFTEKTNRVLVTSSEGESLSIRDIDKMLDKLSKEPLAMLDKKGNALTQYLLECATLPEGFDLEKLRDWRKKYEEDRLEQKREIKILEKQFGEKPEQVEYTDISGLKEQFSIAQKTQSKITEAKSQVQNELTHNKRLRIKLEKLQAEIAENEFQLKSARKNLGTLEENSFDTVSLQSSLEIAYENNEKANAYIVWKKKENTLEAVKTSLAETEELIKKVDRDKRNGLGAAKFPVDGLFVLDDKAWFCGSLLENCGTEEQIKISTALVASKMGEIKVMRVDRAESMGAEARNAMMKVAESYGVQVCMSRVAWNELEENEIEIVDGGIFEF